MILIAGGTGTLGRELVARLTAAGREVRVLTRDADRAEGLPVELAIGDVRDPSSLADAMRGTSVVISAVHGFLGGRGAGPEEVDNHGNGNLVRVALDAGVKRFVLVSVLDAALDHPMSLHRAKYAAERQLRASELPWTILRPSSYIETWTGIVGAKLASGGPAIVFGRADNPINFVSVRDVAALAERAITDPALSGQVIDIPGLDNLTMTELAQHLGASKTRHIPRAALRCLSIVLAPWAPALARQTSAALVMDTTDMSADASALAQQFPDITWHPATDIARRFQSANRGAASN
ncbi:MAG TPA: SDR family oxidoreductase [Nocardioides sp.]|uniref:SDR family oxidoreductase n=1 Tax=Nocardioides sp. TaxID=35761 RepID=UPI002E3752AA|nr:SDR family oxidoreductase [Nocardioides sp.]HEX5090025.1 SDR family oxidoreductase [Nocardioides sp.]